MTEIRVYLCYFTEIVISITPKPYMDVCMLSLI